MITTMEQLKKYAEGLEVELPGFVDTEPFIVRLKRPSLLEMACSGTIPNQLLTTAEELFKNGITNSIRNQDEFKNMGTLLTFIAEKSMADPTYEQLMETGLSLTDLQLMHIYDFVQSGVDLLKGFREKQELDQTIESCGNVRENTQ